MGPSRLPRSVRDSELQVHTVEIPMLLYASTSLMYILYAQMCTRMQRPGGQPWECHALGFLVLETGSLPWPEPIKLARLTSEPQGVSTSTALGWAEPQHSQPFKVCAGDEAERSPQPLCCEAWLCCLPFLVSLQDQTHSLPQLHRAERAPRGNRFTARGSWEK